MNHRPFDRRPTPAGLFAVGVALSAAAFALIALLASDFAAAPAAVMPLLLCLPAVVTSFGDEPPAPDEWDLFGRTEMATLGPLSVVGTDEGGAPWYEATATLAGGGTVRVEHLRLPDVDGFSTDRPLPVEYLPQTRRARVRMDLVETVLRCDDPLSGR